MKGIDASLVEAVKLLFQCPRKIYMSEAKMLCTFEA